MTVNRWSKLFFESKEMCQLIIGKLLFFKSRGMWHFIVAVTDRFCVGGHIHYNGYILYLPASCLDYKKTQNFCSLLEGEQILLDEGSQINVAVQGRRSHCSNCGCSKIKQVSNVPAV